MSSGGGEGQMSCLDMRQHLERKIANADLSHFPFPHMIIENFFPDDVYEKILAFNVFKWTAGREWMSKEDMLLNKNATPYDHRMQINFHSGDPFEAPDEARSFWQEITKVFLSDDWFPKLIYRRFPEYFTLRFGEAVNDDLFWPRIEKQFFLQRHEPDYYIGPHTDIATRIFTCIFSFADRPGFEEYGTQLLRHHDPDKRCWGDSHHGPEDFEVVKTAPYKPNNFLLFFKTRQSFHSARTVTPDVPNQRYGMQFQFHQPSGGIFEDLSNPGLMVPDHDSSLAKTMARLDDAMQVENAAPLAASRAEIEALMQREVVALERAQAAENEARTLKGELLAAQQESERLRRGSLFSRVLKRSISLWH